MEDLVPTWDAVQSVFLSAVVVYAAVIALTRFGGLRSFSKASSFDFAMTVATGSLIASSVLNDERPLFQAVLAIAMLYALQLSVAALRKRWRWVSRVVDNEPRLLMAGREVLHDQLRTARITEDDLRAKLREAGVASPDDVQAVVLETTGDFSVITGSEPPDPALFEGVLGAERLRARGA